MRRAPVVTALIALLALTAVLGVGASAPAPAGPGDAPPLHVVSATDLGALRHPDAATGDGGISGAVGGRILWTYGDTFLSSPAADGSTLRTNTAGWADPRRPFVVRQQVEAATGAPLQLIPFDGAEAAFNRAHRPDGERIALWPLSVVGHDGGRGDVLYQRLVVRPGVLNYQLLGVGLARIRAGAARAERLPGLLFGAGEPPFGTASFLDRGTLYTYACRPVSLSALCRVARVAAWRMADRSAYRFWDGSGWPADVAHARESIPGSTTGYSVAWNAHLHAYLAVYSRPLADQVMARTAPSPQGPWSGETLLLTGAPAPAGSYDYFGVQHPELAAGGGRRIVVTYSHLLDAFHAEIRVVAVVLG